MDTLVILTLIFVYIKSCATIECNKALSTTTYCEKPGYDKAEIPPNIPIVVEMSNSISVSMVQSGSLRCNFRKRLPNYFNLNFH